MLDFLFIGTVLMFFFFTTLGRILGALLIKALFSFPVVMVVLFILAVKGLG